MGTSQGPKNYADMVKRELLEIAERLGITGINKLRKEELVEAIQKAVRRDKAAKDRAAAAGKATPKAAQKSQPRSAAKPAAKASTKPEPKAAPKAQAKAKAAEAKPAPKTAAKAQPRPAARTAAKAEPRTAPQERRPEQAPTASPRPETSRRMSDQSRVTAAKYRVGTPYAEDDLRGVDAHLPGLPDGYGVDRLILLPRDPAWLYAYWDLKNETKDSARREGGQSLALRLYEQVDGGLEPMAEHWCQEVSRSWYLPVPAPGRSYVAEIGYRTSRGSWLGLLRSNVVQVPPAGPSSLVADEFMTLAFDEPLPRPGARTKTVAAPREAPGTDTHEAAYDAAVRGTGMPAGSGALVGVPGSVAGSVPGSGPPWSAGRAAAEQGGFWLLADAELIVFGATEPTAKVTIGDRRVRLRQDGTFSIRMAFPDGTIDVPIVARSEDDEHERSIAMSFERSTRRGSDEQD